jgi:hypothetical protein
MHKTKFLLLSFVIGNKCGTVAHDIMVRKGRNIRGIVLSLVSVTTLLYTVQCMADFLYKIENSVMLDTDSVVK